MVASFVFLSPGQLAATLSLSVSLEITSQRYIQTPHLYLIPSPHKNLAICDISASMLFVKHGVRTCDIKIIIMVFIADNAIGMQW